MQKENLTRIIPPNTDDKDIPLLVKLKDKRFIYNYSSNVPRLFIYISCILYIIFGVTFLSIDKNIIFKCPESRIMYYISIYICLFIGSNIYFDKLIQNIRANKYNKLIFITYPVFISHILIIIWGIIELYIITNNINNDTSIPGTFVNNTDCEKLINTTSWQIGNLTFYISIISFVAYLLTLIYIIAIRDGELHSP